jgi:hypothetical protein
MNHRTLVAAGIALSLAACASTPQSGGPSAPPDYRELVGNPALPNARLYADCLKQAAETANYRQALDGGGEELLLFTCDGAPAAAFYAALGPWSASIGSEFQNDGRTYRSTARVQRNLFGVDYCSAASDADHRCVLSFNAGDFLLR